MTGLWWRSRLRQRLRLLARLAALHFGHRRRWQVQASHAPGRRQWAWRAAAVVAGVVLALATGEVALRIPGFPLPDDVDTYLFNCYSPGYRGARPFFRVDALGIELQKPNFVTRCAWNGHHWTHQSDGWGMRNPTTWDRVDVVLLGDSFVYGHGVDEEQTVAHFLRERLRVRVANFAFMGESAPEYMAKLRNFALPLHPRLAVVLFYQNDLTDLQQRDPQPIQRFIETGEAPEVRVLPRDVLLVSSAKEGTLWERIEHELLAYRALRYLLLLRGEAHIQAPWTFEGTKVLPSIPLDPPEPTQAERLALKYVRAALELMKASCAGTGTMLVVGFIPALIEADGRLDRLVYYQLRELAASLKLPFLDTTPVMLDARGRAIAGTRLANDGHLTELGHRRLAELVAHFIEERKLLGH
jgi:hypothetical protein